MKNNSDFNEKNNKHAVFEVLDDLYKAIREDIGLSNKGLNDKEIIKMYL